MSTYVPLEIATPTLSEDSRIYQQWTNRYKEILGPITTAEIQTKVSDDMREKAIFKPSINIIWFINHLAEVIFVMSVVLPDFHNYTRTLAQKFLFSTILFKASYLPLIVSRLWYIKQNWTFDARYNKEKELYLIRNGSIDDETRKKDLENLEYIMTAKLYIQHLRVVFFSRVYMWALFLWTAILYFLSQLPILMDRKIPFYFMAYVGARIFLLMFVYLPFIFLLCLAAIFKDFLDKRARCKAVQNIPVKEYTTEMAGGKECIICLNDYEERDKVIELRCNPMHHMHESCGRNWLDKNNTCPICRASVVEM